MSVCLNDEQVVQIKTYEKYFDTNLLPQVTAYYRVIEFADHFELSVAFDGPMEEYRMVLANFTRFPTRENNYQGFTLTEIVTFINEPESDIYYDTAEFYDMLKKYDKYGSR